MFDIAFSELLIIGIVALVVIGPERLPKVARTVGHLLGRMQRYVSDVKSDISREMKLDELKKLRAEVQDSAQDLQRSITSEMRSVEQSASETARNVTQEFSPTGTRSENDTGTQPVPPLADGEPARPAQKKT